MSEVKTLEPSAAKRVLISLLFVFILGILANQSFGLLMQEIGSDVDASAQAPLIVAIPSIIIGVVGFMYGALSDFVSLRKLMLAGMLLLFVGSVSGLLFHGSIWNVILANCILFAGTQVSASVYIVVAARYLKDSEKALCFGVFTAMFKLASALGVVAGGMLSSIDWSFIYIIPLFAVFVIPSLFKNLPFEVREGVKIDTIGLVFFGVADLLLVLSFSYGLSFLFGAVLMFCIFGLYICRAKNPFISPEFFKNTRWIKASLLVMVMYASEGVISPLFNAVGGELYGLTPAEVSLYFVWCLLVAGVVSICSGKVVKVIGVSRTLLCSMILFALGSLLCCILMDAGMIALILCGCLFYTGVGLLYSPLLTTVLNTLTPETAGRGIGMFDLTLATGRSVGVTILGGLMGNFDFGGISLIRSFSGWPAVYSNLFVAICGLGVIGILLFILFRKSIYQDGAVEC